MSKKAKTKIRVKMRQEMEAYYLDIRRREMCRIECLQKQLMQDSTYRALNIYLRGLEPRIAWAKAFCFPELDQLLREERRLKSELAQRMTALNISKSDLMPKWQCSKCSDTGFLPDGKLCGCYL